MRDKYCLSPTFSKLSLVITTSILLSPLLHHDQFTMEGLISPNRSFRLATCQSCCHLQSICLRTISFISSNSKGYVTICNCRPSFASSSTVSFPKMSQWLGIHCSDTSHLLVHSHNRFYCMFVTLRMILVSFGVSGGVMFLSL